MVMTSKYPPDLRDSGGHARGSGDAHIRPICAAVPRAGLSSAPHLNGWIA